MSTTKQIVTEAYDHLAEWYSSWVNDQPFPRERYADKILQNQTRDQTSSPSPSPLILDIGSGPGVPVTRFLLSRGARVVANDISSNQLALAKLQCRPFTTATFVLGDMTSLHFDEGSFDGVVCFFALFHLPRAEQRVMLGKIHEWLRPRGLLVCNFATVDEEEIYGEMMGRGIFWSGFGVGENRTMLMGVGFEVVDEEVLESDADGGVEFMWVAARKGAMGRE